MRNLLIILAVLLSALLADLLWIHYQHNSAGLVATPTLLPFTPPVPTNQALKSGTPAPVQTAEPAAVPPIAHASKTAFPAINTQPFTIRWGLVNEPPFHIQFGPEQQQGFCDVLVERLRVYLADVQHQTVAGLQDQLRQQLYAGDNLCLPCSIAQATRPGRLYSKPTHFMQTHGVIIRTADAAMFIQRFGSPVRLEQLLRSELKFARPHTRRYGSIQPLLERYQQADQLIAASQFDEPSLQMLRWLSHGQVDYVIDYVSTLRYFSRHDRAALQFLPLADFPRWLPAAVSCPDTNWGQLAILRVNAAIDKIRQDAKLQQSLQQWFSADLPSYQHAATDAENSAAKP